jgi:hypothetical protein
VSATSVLCSGTGKLPHMATDFDPVPPPLDLPAVPSVLSPSIPLNPPMVGSVNPFVHVDGNNRDLILEAIRTWIRVSLLPWTTSWQDQLTEWESDVETQLDAWMVLADAYITAHAISGYSFRPTVTDIAPAGTTNVVLANVDETFRPVVVGDLILDGSPDSNYGIVTVVIDATHATVVFVGTLRGLPGLSWRLTATPIAPEGTTDVVLAADAVRPFSAGDLVLDTTADGNFGIITVIIDATHVTVTYAGSLIGPQGIRGSQGEPGENGTNGTNGTDGVMSSIVAGTNISVDSTDPANPIVSATSAGALYFTDPAALAAATDHPAGTLAILSDVTHGLYTSLFIRTDTAAESAPQRWTAAQLRFTSADPADWAATVAWIAPSDSVDLTAAVGMEMINGLVLQWSPTNQLFQAPLGYARFPTIGANSNGTVTANPDNSVSFAGSTAIEVTKIVPQSAQVDSGLPVNADTNEYVIRLHGLMSANGLMKIQLSGSGGTIGTFAYATFGETLQQNGGTLTHDADFTNGYNAEDHWSIVTDTTGNPVYVDATVTIRNQGVESEAVTGTVDSVFYDALEMNVIYRRTGTLYFYGQGYANYDGFLITTSETIDGYLTVKGQ